MNKICKSKRAQIWSLDLIVASVIFLIGIITVYIFIINFPGEAEENMDSLLYEGNIVASNLLTEGVPMNWPDDPTLNNVIIPGLLSGNQINDTKLQNFTRISNATLKRKLDTKFDFCFNISYGFPSYHAGICTSSPSSAQNIIKVTRLIIYNNTPRSFELYIWK